MYCGSGERGISLMGRSHVEMDRAVARYNPQIGDDASD
jgi:hypothetical protein